MNSIHSRRLRQLAHALLATTTLPALAQNADAPAAEPATVVVRGQAGAPPAYAVDNVNLGPLGERSWLQAPFAISAAPEAVLANQQTKSVRDALRLLPWVQGENIRPQTRGLQAGVVQNTRIDGLNIAATTDYPAEQFERVEVLNGLAGALYGPANPAGTFNYAIKRPTAQPLRRVMLGLASQSSLLVHADLSDRVDADRRLSYRLNLLDDNGEGVVDRSRLQRRLASLALDLQLTPDTVAQANASHYHYLRRGYASTFALASKVDFPAAPDPTRLGYGQPYAGDDNSSDTVSLRLQQRLGPRWQWSAGLLRQNGERASTVPTNTLTSNAGAYTTTAATTTFSRDALTSNSLSLTGRLAWGAVEHELVLANTGFDWDRYTPLSTGAITLGSASLDQPALFAQPVWPDFTRRYPALSTRQQSLTLGDTMRLGPRWSLMLVASQSVISVRNLDKQGAVTSRYGDHAFSPAASVSFSPAPGINSYLSHATSLQPGDTAPAGTVNAGEALAPYRSAQWELGYKQLLSNSAGRSLQLGAALFQIERPFAMTDAADKRFKPAGRQRNRGLELSASGQASADLSLLAGIAWLQPVMLDTGSAATSGQTVMGLARLAGNALVDWRVRAVPGLSVNLNLNRLGRRPGNHTNTSWVSGFTTADVGARLAGTLLGRPATWRLTVSNLANARYWANISPSGQNGYSGAGSGTGTLGAPRQLQASVQFDL